MHRWIAGRFEPDGSAAPTQEKPDKALMGRVGGALYGGGASLALLWLALPHPNGGNDLLLLVTVLIPAFSGAALMWFLGERLSQVAYHALVALGIVLISAAIFFSGRSGTPFVLFYLWSNLYAWYFFPRRLAAGHLALTGICYALVLGLRDPNRSDRTAANSHGVLPILGPSPARWLITLGTVAITGLLVAFLRERVDRLIAGLTKERNVVVARAAREAAVAELGREALGGLSMSELIDRSLDTLTAQLEVDQCEVWEPVAFGEELELAGARGELEERVHKLTIPNGSDAEPGFALRADGPLIVSDYSTETRFRRPRALKDEDVVSGLTVRIAGPRSPLGVLSAHARRAGAFTDDDALFMESIANVLGAAMARWHAEEAVRHNALHDPLTGLPNRALFLDRLRHVLARRRPGVPHASVMFMDIDNFKLINDSLGHDAGDQLLKAIAARLQGSLRIGDTVARFGGDEFVVLCEEVGDGRDALVIAERVQKALAEPFHLEEETHFLSASIGVTVASGRYQDADTLMGDADAAMYGAKERGRAQCELFDDAMRTKVLSRLRMENALRGVLERDELRVFYQPIVSVADGSIRGLEALMRWNHSGLGPVSPIEFIPIAEETGLIVPLGAWVIEEACRQSRLWSEELGIKTPPISVNLSPRQVSDAGLVSTVRNALEKSGLEPGQLALEITESVLVSEADSPWNTIEALKRLGVRLLLDDFGTGYSSLSYLKRFPVDALKIDRSFIDGLGDEAEDSAIVNAIIGMARALDIKVVAEGVETERQVTCLRELGCEHAQGFLFGRPREASSTTDLLRPADIGATVVPLSGRISAAEAL